MSYFVCFNPINFQIGSYTLDDVDFALDLGVVFDIDYTILKGYIVLGFIRRNSYLNTLKMVYVSYVRSKLKYASVLLCPYSDTHIVRFERVQRKFLKMLIFSVRILNPLRTYWMQYYY